MALLVQCSVLEKAAVTGELKHILEKQASRQKAKRPKTPH